MIRVEFVGQHTIDASLNSQAFKAAVFRALNRTVDGMRTDISTEVRSTFNLSKQTVDPRIKIDRAKSYDSLEAMATVKGGEKSAMPLIGFGAVARRNLESGSIKTLKGRNGFYSQRMKKQVGQGGVTYKVLKSGGKGFSADAFIIPGGGGSLQVVRRKKGQKGNKGLKEKRIISVVGMIKSSKRDVMERVMAGARLRWQKNIEREWEFYKKVAETQAIGGLRANGRGYQL